MTFSADAHLSKLKLFQRHTVEHVCRRFFDDVPAARRFLVADETGLGKSMVARGVIAKTIDLPKAHRFTAINASMDSV